MLFQFPSPMIFSHVIPDHAEVKEYLMEYIDFDVEGNGKLYESKNTWNCDVTSSFFRTNPLEFLTTEIVNKIVWEPLQQFSTESPPHQSVCFTDLSLLSLWYNRYAPGQHQEAHRHVAPRATITISGIYLIDLSEENTTAFIYDSPAWCTEAQVHHKTDSYVEGTVILFPSDLLHYVRPSTASRTTISFNLGVLQ